MRGTQVWFDRAHLLYGTIGSSDSHIVQRKSWKALQKANTAKLTVFNVWLSSHIWLFRLESSQLIAARFLDQRQRVSLRPGPPPCSVTLQYFSIAITGTVGDPLLLTVLPATQASHRSDTQLCTLTEKERKGKI
ncbi:hypothetical protein EYF80_000886 [Liparis tanakae]|uniref:Uncharacterized protein n=1 Tax=Liparis tanakae TaxID=230148 RepID=A0A4Z2JH79_9TELE|nr:hypothetical protein EYF80_000886 [Liparis tanakae]